MRTADVLWVVRYVSAELLSIAVPILVAASLVALPCDGRCQAQSLPTVTAAGDSFRAELDAIAKKWSVAVVAESYPIARASVADPALVKPGESVDEAVARVAAAYDYTAAHRNGVFVLLKRFTNPEDIPDITLEEATRALRNMDHMLAPFDTSFAAQPRPFSDRAVAIADVLSRNQIASLGSGGVPVSSLTAEQRAVIWRFALWYYLDAIRENIRTVLGLLAPMARHDPVFRWGVVTGGPENEFGFDTLAVDGQSKIFIPISNPQTLTASSDGRVARHSARVPGDPAEPAVDAAGSIVQVANPVRSESLGDVLTELNSRTTEHIKCALDGSLAAKSVTTAGLENSSLPHIALALAEVYGLEFRHRNDGTITIGQQPPSSVEDIERLPAALMAAIPGSVRRCIGAGLSHYRGGVPKQMKSQIVINADYHRGAGLTCYAAIRQVRTVAQPAVQLSKSGQVGLAELGGSCARAFAVSQSIHPFASALWIAESQPPPFIADFDHIILTGGLSTNNGQSRLNVGLSYKDPKTGNFYMGVGIFNALIPTR